MRKINVGEWIYHVLVFAMFLRALTMDLGFPAHKVTYGGRLKYYTIWNLCLAVFYYGFSTLVDFVHLLISDQMHGIRKIRDYIFCSLVVPASMNVSIAFWIIFAMSPEFIQSKEDQEYQPVFGYFNQVAHSGPILTTFFEAVMVFHKPPSKFMVGCLGGLIYGSAYAVWLYYVAHVSGIWAYPFLEVMTDLQRVGYFSVCYAFGFFCYYLVASIIKCVWASELLDTPSRKNKNMKQC